MSKLVDVIGLKVFFGELKKRFVMKDGNKSLSTNDYTNEEKNKLSGLSNYILPEATGHILGGVKIGSGIDVVGGTISINLSPYAKTSEIENLYAKKGDVISSAGVDSKLLAYVKTEDLVNFAKKSDIAKAVHYRGSVNAYSELPSSGMAVGDMYNVVSSDAENGVKAGDNVVYNGNSWDNLGGTVDLSDYATKKDVENAVLGGIQIATDGDIRNICQ